MSSNDASAYWEIFMANFFCANTAQVVSVKSPYAISKTENIGEDREWSTARDDRAAWNFLQSLVS
jgi:hypothetical protein